MRDFNNSAERGKIETLLKSTDTTDLKIIIILLPQGEGGTHANYDWKGGSCTSTPSRKVIPHF